MGQLRKHFTVEQVAGYKTALFEPAPWRKLTQPDEARGVSCDEVDRYDWKEQSLRNNYQVRSTTGEIPSLRFDMARKSGTSLFRPFSLPKPYSSSKDIFCLCEMHTLNDHRRISLFRHEIEIPRVPVYVGIELHLIPISTGKRSMSVFDLNKRSFTPSVSPWPIQ